MEMQIKFIGTPLQFAYAVNAFSRQFSEVDKERHFWNPYYVIRTKQDDASNKVEIRFGGRGARAVWEFGYVTAVSGAPGNSVLFVTGRDEHWSKLKEWWELLYAELKQQGWVDAPTKPAKGAAQEQDAGLVFTNKGGGWEICYRGESQIQPTSKGIATIAILLQNPNKEFGAVELAQVTEKNGATNASLSAGEIAEEGLTISKTDDAGDVIDEQAKQEYRAKFDELTEQKRIATELDDYNKAEQCENEIEKIITELTRASGLKGKTRKIGGQSEKARAAKTQSDDDDLLPRNRPCGKPGGAVYPL
jgi:hypothetical protein